MATQGPLYPTVASTAAGPAPETSDAWVTPANIQDADADEATITAASYDSPDVSQRLTAKTFGFTIPSGSTIDGITVEVNRRSIVANSGKDYRVQLLDAAGALVGANKAATATIWPTSAATATYGGAADTWTANPTVAMVNDPDFGVVLAAQANIANADIGVAFIRVTVTYTPPAFNTLERSAAIGATGAVASQGSFWSVLTGQAVVAATGLVASAGSRISAPVERSAALGATGAIASIGRRVFLRSASLGASGAVASASNRILQRSAGLGGNAGVASTGQGILERSAALIAASALAASGQREVQRAAGVGAVAAIQSATPAVHERSASLGAVTYFGATGPNGLPRWISAPETQWRMSLNA